MQGSKLRAHVDGRAEMHCIRLAGPATQRAGCYNNRIDRPGTGAAKFLE